MRELKFRVWDNENNKYYEPTYLAYDNKLEELFLMQCGQICMRKIDGIYGQSNFPNRFIVEQFTGLNDKNGVEIYEGDIIDLHANGKEPVVYENGSFVCKQGGLNTLLVLCVKMQMGEVIGNIHEGVRNDGRD